VIPLKEIQDKDSKIYRYDLIAIDPDDDSQLYENIIFSTDELSEANNYIESNYIPSNKIIYIHDHNYQTIKGVLRSTPKLPKHLL
jgi:hypothetical protein